MVNVSVFGPLDLIKKIGKKGTETDLVFYNLKADQQYTFIAPNSDKFQARLFAANIGHCGIIIVPESGPDLMIGEAILILDALQLPGIIIAPPGFESQLSQISKGTVVEKYPIVPVSDFRLESLKLLKPQLSSDSNPRVPIDHFFDVKSVGTVVLGTTRGGVIKQYDNMVVNPIGKGVAVRSIQVQDEDLKETKVGDRVGLALKGIDISELDRGFVVSKNPLPKTAELKIKFTQVKFAPKIEKLQGVMVNIGLQFVPGTVTEVGDTTSIDLEKEIVVDGKVIVTRPELPKIKIIGSGVPI